MHTIRGGIDLTQQIRIDRRKAVGQCRAMKTGKSRFFLKFTKSTLENKNFKKYDF